MVRNVDKAEHQGVEFELTWLPTDSLTIGGNGRYTKTEYKSDFFGFEDDNPAFPAAWTSYDWRFDSGVLAARATWASTSCTRSEGPPAPSGGPVAARRPHRKAFQGAAQVFPRPPRPLVRGRRMTISRALSVAGTDVARRGVWMVVYGPQTADEQEAG